MKRLLLMLSFALLTANLTQAQDFDRREYRAVWLTTFLGLDWPKGHDPLTQQKQLCRILDQLQAAKVNTVLFQVRLRGTTAYASDIEPWDGIFTGTPGQRPTYDPLAFAIEECHRRGMELHAWMVAFPVCKLNVLKALGTKSVVRKHPELCRRSDDQYIMDPGMPGTADYLANLCRELVSQYDVDGIHLDYIRYPEAGLHFDDAATYRKYGKGRDLKTWRRDNVTRVVEKIHEAVKSQKPWVRLSCAPVGKYADLPRQSSRGWNARDAVGQDAIMWLNKGWMDVLFPMMYFDGDNYYPFVLDWLERAERGTVAPGLGVYCLSAGEKNWPLLTLQRQMNFLRTAEAGGFALFRSDFLTNNTKGVYNWLAGEYTTRPVLTPPMANPQGALPATPRATLTRLGYGLHFNFPIDEIHNIYIKEGKTFSFLGQTATGHFTYRPALPARLYAEYAVKAMDRYGCESQPAFLKIGGEIQALKDTLHVADLPIDVKAFWICDAFGRKLRTVDATSTIDVSDLRPGCYELRTVGRKGGSHRVRLFRR